jgi:hypothetical protein
MNYRQILDRENDLVNGITKAYAEQDWRIALEMAREIGKLYSPDDPLKASQLGFMISTLANSQWFAAKQDSVRQRYSAQF